MKEAKVSWKLILITIAIPLVIGLLVNLNSEESLGWLFGGLFYVAVIVFGFGGYAIAHSIRTKGLGKGLLVGILIFLLLIPLAFLGTCTLGIGGTYLRGLFIK